MLDTQALAAILSERLGKPVTSKGVLALAKRIGVRPLGRYRYSYRWDAADIQVLVAAAGSKRARPARAWTPSPLLPEAVAATEQHAKVLLAEREANYARKRARETSRRQQLRAVERAARQKDRAAILDRERTEREQRLREALKRVQERRRRSG